jgi:hypothetical protein
MPMPKRASVDDYFAQLAEVQPPHLQALRKLSLDADTKARSLRFPPEFFATRRDAVEAAGFEAGEGFIKLPYTRALPTTLLKSLMKARVRDYEASESDV